MTLSAVQKEAAWLAAVDALPSLLIANGGPLEIVNAYWPRTPVQTRRGLYLFRADAAEERSANYRTIRTHRFTARVLWPMSGTTNTAEAAQLGLDLAVDLVLARIRGLPGDHTHGGAFLSVAEGVTAEDNSGRISVVFSDPEQAIAAKQPFRADITYHADDLEVTQ